MPASVHHVIVSGCVCGPVLMLVDWRHSKRSVSVGVWQMSWWGVVLDAADSGRLWD